MTRNDSIRPDHALAEHEGGREAPWMLHRRIGRARSGLAGFELRGLLLQRPGMGLQLGRRRRVVDRLGQASIPLRLFAQTLHAHAAPPGLLQPECPRCRKRDTLVTLWSPGNINDARNRFADDPVAKSPQ